MKNCRLKYKDKTWENNGPSSASASLALLNETYVRAVFARSGSNPCTAPLNLEEATSYEKAVFEAVSYLISVDRDDDIAIEMHFELLKQFPRDLASLKRAQVLCFYTAKPDLFLDLINKVLPHNQQENYIYGMLAFPLLELGRMVDAEEAARKGLEINEFDVWAQHNLCHVLQYNCQFKEATEFMENCSSSWVSCSSFMYTHNWWHVALCYLDGHSPIRKVVEVYDRIWKELHRSDSSSAEVYLNALAFFLRIDVRDQMDSFGDRLEILADCKIDKSVWHLEWHLDVLILWALAKMGKLKIAEELLEAMKSRRIKKTEGIPFLWRLLERGHLLAGSKDTDVIAEKARVLEAAYFK
ncbi:hypothetical protein ACHQM5_007226 [Ranunculus cassubicifolius]